MHAIGKGILLLEVQQNSDITYRIYDYEKIGLNGEKRGLHFEKAIDLIDFQSKNYEPKPYTVEETDFAKTTLVECNYQNVP